MVDDRLMASHHDGGTSSIAAACPIRKRYPQPKRARPHLCVITVGRLKNIATDGGYSALAHDLVKRGRDRPVRRQDRAPLFVRWIERNGHTYKLNKAEEEATLIASRHRNGSPALAPT